MGRTACTKPQCLYKGALYFYLYLYSPVWAVRPVQSLSACTRVHLYLYLYLYSPVWAVGSVQSLSACTRVHLYLYLYLYSPYGPYGLYRASVPVQGSPLPLPIPLLPLWSIRPVQSLSACTRVHLYLYLYLYSPYRPYGLYRASVPVQGCTFAFCHLLLHAINTALKGSLCSINIMWAGVQV